MIFLQKMDSDSSSSNSSSSSSSSSRSHCVRLLRKATSFLCATVGLVVLVALYAVAGGVMFAYLEQKNEQSQCLQERDLYAPLLNDTLRRIAIVRASYKDKEDKPYARKEFTRVMRAFRDEVLSVGYDGTDCEAMGRPGGPIYQWSFTGSFLFACTVFTTIGYGNIAPRTFWGRIICIAYALIGIPLMLICLSNIGEFLSNVFRFVYFELFCCRCLRRRRPRSLDQSSSPSTVAQTHEEWRQAYEGTGENSQRRPERSHVEVIDDDDDDDEDEMEKRTIPLTVTLAMMGWYVFFGALLFGVIEGWDWMQSAYYCFVTISTIGFGDFVPGVDDLANTEGQLKMIGAAAYLLVGMSLMSMTFNLLQEEMTEKVKWIGEKLQMFKKEATEQSQTNPPIDDLALQPFIRQRGTGRPADMPQMPLIYLDDKDAYLSLAEYNNRLDPSAPLVKDGGHRRRQHVDRLLPSVSNKIQSVHHGEAASG